MQGTVATHTPSTWHTQRWCSTTKGGPPRGPGHTAPHAVAYTTRFLPAARHRPRPPPTICPSTHLPTHPSAHPLPTICPSSSPASIIMGRPPASQPPLVASLPSTSPLQVLPSMASAPVGGAAEGGGGGVCGCAAWGEARVCVRAAAQRQGNRLHVDACSRDEAKQRQAAPQGPLPPPTPHPRAPLGPAPPHASARLATLHPWKAGSYCPISSLVFRV